MTFWASHSYNLMFFKKRYNVFYEKHWQKRRHLCQYSWIRWLLFQNIVTPFQSACSYNLDSYLVSVVEVLGGGKTDMTACWWKRRRRRPARVWGSGKWRCQARSLCHKWLNMSHGLLTSSDTKYFYGKLPSQFSISNSEWPSLQLYFWCHFIKLSSHHLAQHCICLVAVAIVDSRCAPVTTASSVGARRGGGLYRGGWWLC